MNFLIAILLLASSSFLLGMEERSLVKPSATAAKIEKWANRAAGLELYHHPERESLPSENFFPSEFRAYCPNPLPEPHERLTDAMFLSLPAVQELQKLDMASKNAQLKRCDDTLAGDYRYYIKRSTFAACIAAGADPNYSKYMTKDPLFEGSALQESTLMQDFRLTQFLLERGADPNRKNYSDQYSLCLAKNKYMAKLLCAYSAQLQSSLLHRTIGCVCTTTMEDTCTTELLTWYLKKGLDPNARKCSFYCTPLHTLACFAESDSSSMVKCKALLNAGARIDIKNDRGETFLDRVKEAQSQDIYDSFSNLVATYKPQSLYNRFINKRLEKAKNKEEYR